MSCKCGDQCNEDCEVVTNEQLQTYHMMEICCDALRGERNEHSTTDASAVTLCITHCRFF